MTQTSAAPPALIETIAQWLGHWQTPHVELAVYGCADPQLIADTLNEFCRLHLHATIAQPRFYESSIGAVLGAQLDDGREVVIKAHQADWSRAHLAEIARLQQHVSERLGWAPPILAGPVPLGRGYALVEPLLMRGEWADPHRPEICEALALGLADLVELLQPFASTASLPASLLTSYGDRLWPKPHSRLFDFDATRKGAEDIDALAHLARSRMSATGRRVIAHSDWRPQHVRFEDDRPVLAFDWDSLCLESELALLGVTLHLFCADWSPRVPAGYAQAPTLEEARAFLDAYEVRRAQAFTQPERATIAAQFAYSVAYTARCKHALGGEERNCPGTFQHLLASRGEGLLQL